MVTVAAEKGYLRETGNLVFHVALLLLLAGIALGGLFGYKGTVLVTIGPGGFSNAQSQYDVFYPARLFSDSSAVAVLVDAAEVHGQLPGQRRADDVQRGHHYKTDPTAASKPYDIEVNHPLNIGGAKVFLVGHGYSMRLSITNAAGQHRVRRADTRSCRTTASSASHGVVKVPDLGREAAARPHSAFSTRRTA